VNQTLKQYEMINSFIL